jgi:deoxyribodipyrimidine photo-lyase
MSLSIFWFRRDLRLRDNAGLYHALRSGQPVLPIFIFDCQILDALAERSDARVHFIHQTLAGLKADLQALGSDLYVAYGRVQEVWDTLLASYPQLSQVYCNRDYEPYALERDAQVKAKLEQRGIRFFDYKDQVIFERLEIAKADGLPYTVFTPYARRWREKLHSAPDAEYLSEHFKPYPSEQYLCNFYPFQAPPLPSLAEMNFQPSDIAIPSAKVSQKLIKAYAEQRNFPAVQGTSRLGIHFRFGTISIREKALKAHSLSEVFLNELIWRDFYAMILANFPHVATQAFKPEYDRIEWRRSEEDFARWCAGKTGYPMVDAGMRELNATGFMHNRVRMIAASFLTKHLLLDWRWGEAYFAAKLLDFDLASNNGGWQWAAGCGTDAAPYFRIFNPQSQQEKFDPKGEYLRQWLLEYGTADYPAPMVDHAFARQRCLETYKRYLGKAED